MLIVGCNPAKKSKTDISWIGLNDLEERSETGLGWLRIQAFVLCNSLGQGFVGSLMQAQHKY